MGKGGGGGGGGGEILSEGNRGVAGSASSKFRISISVTGSLKNSIRQKKPWYGIVASTSTSNCVGRPTSIERAKVPQEQGPGYD